MSSKTALNHAVMLLAQRDYASHTLREKLTAKGFDTDEIEAALSRLQSMGYVSDAGYTEKFVSYQAARGKGPLHVSAQLAAKGISWSLSDSEQSLFIEGGRALVAKKRLVFDTPQQKQKNFRYLFQRGYPLAMVEAIVSEVYETE